MGGTAYDRYRTESRCKSLCRTLESPTYFIVFEEQVHLDHTSFIDGMIPSTRVMIEQKGLGKDLKKPIKQSDGTFLTPF
ncbi:MAG: hypothetical protein LIP11_14050 [Clostridiales bacterium]|nr:hypothetical protein [Clostridiales bacterium]